MADPLQIQTFPLGEWMTNCYIVFHKSGGPCWIIDAGFDPQPMLDFMEQEALVPQQVLLTHAHVDHIAGLEQVRAAYANLPILIHPTEMEFLTDASLNLSLMLAEPIVAPQATGVLEHGQTIELEGSAFAVRHTPGHSPGGITLYCQMENVALVGDTLFAGSIGRSDFPTSDGQILEESIREQLLTLPESTRILPGHGPASTIGQERRSNPYII
jgi:hydroxyacylglutathione hydrolase